MRTIGAFEAKVHLSRLLRDVEMNNDEIIIQRHHRNIAALIPYQRSLAAGAVDVAGGFSRIRAKQSRLNASVKDLVNEGRKR